VEKREGQIKKLVNAEKENMNSRHWGSPVRTLFFHFSCIHLEDSESDEVGE
jgi:hypothetical protein